MNNTLEGIHSRITEAEEQINDLEDRNVGNHYHRTEEGWSVLPEASQRRFTELCELGNIT